MLRRKKKSPKAAREARAPRGAHAIHETPAPRSRRRARPDAVVPAELRFDPAELVKRPSPRPSPRGEGELRSPRPSSPTPRSTPRVPGGAGESPAIPVRPRDGRNLSSARGAPSEPNAAGVQKGAGVILVTGFEPFGGEDRNPSWEICSRLPQAIAGRRVETCRVPCEFRGAIEVVAEAIERVRPEIVVSLGQAGGRSQLGVERVGINVDDARMPDNAGSQPVDEVIAENGPPAYFATLPVKAMVAAMRRAGVPAELSNTAGTYVCNHLMYGVLHFLAASGNPARAGFIHVPHSEEQVLDKPGAPAMSVATMARGVEAAIGAALGHAIDIRASEGREA